MVRGRNAFRVRPPSAEPPDRVGSPPPISTTDPLLQAVEHPSLDEKIYLRLRALIVERRILPGERIQVDRLASHFGVSRTPVLNALKRLAQEQLVEWRARHGVYVKYPTTRELAYLFEVREVLEGLAARRAAVRITSDEVDQFITMFKGLDFTADRAAFPRYLEIDQRFHLRVVEIADSQPLAHAMNAVNLMIFTFQMGLIRPPAETIPEHLAILTALRKRDPDASERAMHLHLGRSRERLTRKAEAEETRGPALIARTHSEKEEPGERIRQVGDQYLGADTRRDRHRT
jgi:DNA-binding GntR family transcriptional regulator